MGIYNRRRAVKRVIVYIVCVCCVVYVILWLTEDPLQNKEQLIAYRQPKNHRRYSFLKNIKHHHKHKMINKPEDYQTNKVESGFSRKGMRSQGLHQKISGILSHSSSNQTGSTKLQNGIEIHVTAHIIESTNSPNRIKFHDQDRGPANEIESHGSADRLPSPVSILRIESNNSPNRIETHDNGQAIGIEHYSPLNRIQSPGSVLRIKSNNSPNKIESIGSPTRVKSRTTNERAFRTKRQKGRIESLRFGHGKIWNMNLSQIQQNLNMSSQTHCDSLSLYPDPKHIWDDRIYKQLTYKLPEAPLATKKIYVTQFLLDFETTSNWKCLVRHCAITTNTSHIHRADLVILNPIHTTPKEVQIFLRRKRRYDQIWAMETRENAIVTRDPFQGKQFNWTISYSPWSTLSNPFGKMYPKTPGITTLQQTKNWADGKSKKVVIFMNHCLTQNRRLEYVTELAKYISVDMFGKCGRALPDCANDNDGGIKCVRENVKNYKFYLAFENANCKTYVSEKFFKHALRNDVIPIVMGAPKSYYRAISPSHSFIHVQDFKSARQLAEYLDTLDKNEDLYNEYFKWKGAWEYLNMGSENLYCRLCAMLHAPIAPLMTMVTDMAEWRRKEECRASVEP